MMNYIIYPESNYLRSGKLFFSEVFMLFYEKGQGLVEYALIIVLIAIVVILALSFLAPTIGNVFTEIGVTLSEGI